MKDVLSITSLHSAKVKTKYSHSYVMWTQNVDIYRWVWHFEYFTVFAKLN